MGKKASKLKAAEPLQRQDDSVVSNQLTNKWAVTEAQATTLDLDDEWLLEIIDINHSLLEELRSSLVIDENQLELIRGQSLSTDKIRQLLEEVKKMTPAQQEQFLTVLTDDKQSHVSSYLRHNGQRPAEDDDRDNWPIAVCNDWSWIEENWTELVDTIQSGKGLLDKLSDANCVTELQEQTIFKQQASFKRNEELLDTIKRRSVRDYNKFIECLKNFRDYVTRSRPSKTTDHIPLRFNDERLLELIDVQHGLLRELRSCHVLTQRQVEFIESKGLPTEMVHQLLNEITGMEHEKQCLFLTALDKLQQSHVANYIRNNGERPTSVVDDWPLAVCSQWKTLEENWATVVRTVEVDEDFIKKLTSSKCINGRQEQTLSLTSLTGSQRNEILFNFFKHGSIRTYKIFIKCLASCDCVPLASLLASRSARSVELSGGQLINMPRTNQSALAQLIDTKNTSLLDHLIGVDSITMETCEMIRNTSRSSEANLVLLQAMSKRCYADLFMFAMLLEQTGQAVAADFLTSKGIVETLVAQTDANLEEEEMCVEKFMKLLTGTSPKFRDELRSKVNKTCAEVDNDRAYEPNEVIAVQATSSIKFFILCKSWLGFSYLHELYSSENLTEIIQQMISPFFKQRVSVKTLVWSMSDYIQCAYYFSVVENLEIYRRVYELAQQSLDDSEEHEQLRILPHSFDELCRLDEVMKLLLLKAAGQLFAIVKKMIARADIYILAMLCAVSSDWWETLLHQKSNKALLIHYFQRVYHPYQFKAKFVNTLSPPPLFHQMVEFNDKLYLTNPHKIQVLDVASNLNASEEDINLPNEVNLIDSAVCTTTGCLFIISISNNFSSKNFGIIWRIELLYNNKVTQWLLIDYMPGKISLRFDRLLVIPKDGEAIFLYNKDSKLLHRRVRIPPTMYVHHAVETVEETFIVSSSQRKGRSERSPQSVCELSRVGHVLRSYEGTIPLPSLVNLTVAVNDDILVVDSMNQQILVISSELEIKQLIQANFLFKGRKVHGLWYSRQTGKLYVACNYIVNVFMLTQ